MQGRSICHVLPAFESGVWGQSRLQLATNPGYDASPYLMT